MSKREKEADGKGATEDQVNRIESIDRTEALGYDGESREEHSGQNEPVPHLDTDHDLADNEADEIPPKRKPRK